MKRLLTGIAAAAIVTLTSLTPVFAADKSIKEINITVEAPKAGESAAEKPVVSVDAEGVKVTNAVWLNADEILEPFKGTFAEGKEYGVEVDMSVEEAYELSETDLKITVNGKSVSGTIGDNSISVFSSVKAVADEKDSTPDSASTSDSATTDSATTDGANNANGSIPTNEGNGTFVLFGVVIGIVAVAGVAYFIYIKKNK